MTVRRVKSAAAEVRKEAMRIPKQVKGKKQKNIETNAMGDRTARVHLGKQNYNEIVIKKTKALKKRRRDQSTQAEEAKAAQRQKKY